ncbi:hypothetical protein VHEMI00731 [[Torrubiella] hemipterigena]|uniref:Uncharacterized protein n=1 Tax=[Torrubiella] hemipterigena TaxID=1531966 RepID=A0A0A1T378_9HYPO|nr:hypothetical protein VHEMI00731 [[Torrubiella] hemipterigena]
MEKYFSTLDGLRHLQNSFQRIVLQPQRADALRRQPVSTTAGCVTEIFHPSTAARWILITARARSPYGACLWILRVLVGPVGSLQDVPCIRKLALGRGLTLFLPSAGFMAFCIEYILASDNVVDRVRNMV